MSSNEVNIHRRPKLRIRGVICFFLLICERSAKRDMGHILLPNNRIAGFHMTSLNFKLQNH